MTPADCACTLCLAEHADDCPSRSSPPASPGTDLRSRVLALIDRCASEEYWIGVAEGEYGAEQEAAALLSAISRALASARDEGRREGIALVCRLLDAAAKCQGTEPDSESRATALREAAMCFRSLSAGPTPAPSESADEGEPVCACDLPSCPECRERVVK